MDIDRHSFRPVETQDATPLVVPLLSIPESSIANVVVIVNALTAAGVAAGWRRHALVKRGVGPAILVGVPSEPFVAKDAGAALWAIALSVNGATLVLTVTGLAATAIRWAAHVDITTSRMAA